MANKANVKKWVKALRSGKFKQCREKLFDGKGYCCLGIVCVLAGMKPKKKGNSFYFGKERSYLPRTAERWLGVEHNPTIGYRLATTLNDENRHSFSKIADEIEKHGVQ